MALFCRANRAVREKFEKVRDLYHPDLAEADAQIGIVMAYADRDDAGQMKRFAIVKHGLRVLGRIKINNLENRVDGKPDATLTLDGDHWADLEAAGREEDQLALIDHELTHLVVQRGPGTADRRGDILVDVLSRPLFSIRNHDWELTGFREVAERHGAAAAEVQEALLWRDTHGNLLFSFAEELAARPGGTDGEA